MKDGTGWGSAPSVGQRFTDNVGKHWHVLDVIRGPGEDAYYIVRLAYGATLDCAEGVSLLGRGEFADLCRIEGLQPLQIDVALNEQGVLPHSPGRRGC